MPVRKKIKRQIGVKATEAAVKHSARGLSAKAKRKPLRSAGLLCVGIVLGFAAGWKAHGNGVVTPPAARPS